MRTIATFRKCTIAGACLAGLVATTSAFGQPEIRFFPIRSAPLGSPPGTIGDAVTPSFNPTLGCWEVLVPPGVEVDLDLQAFGWGAAPGNPSLVAVVGMVDAAGFDNGVGTPLNPKGWPSDPNDGAYQATTACSGNGDPCSPPFDGTCNGLLNGLCVDNPNWVMPPCAADLHVMALQDLNYGWGVVAQYYCTVDGGTVKTFGGLILEVPPGAVGTYTIALSPDPNLTFMTDTYGAPIPNLTLTPACIKIGNSACCTDGDGDGIAESCEDGTTAESCAANGGTFVGQDSTCSAISGACILDTDGDGFDDSCAITNESCCGAQGGTFRGDGTNCDSVGACCLDANANQFLEDLCANIDLASCDAQGGSFQGVGTSCLGDANGNGTDDACDNEIPAVSAWGLIVLTLLLLVGIKVHFGRRLTGAPGT